MSPCLLPFPSPSPEEGDKGARAKLGGSAGFEPLSRVSPRTSARHSGPHTIHPCPSLEVRTAFEVAATVGVARLQDLGSRPRLFQGPLLSRSAMPLGSRTARRPPEHAAP